jgi:DNA replication protein DnaC
MIVRRSTGGSRACPVRSHSHAAMDAIHTSSRAARVALLILGDRGLTALASREGRDLLEIIDDRHGRGLRIVTSLLPLDHWHEMIADPTLADAVLDRLVPTRHRIALDGETLRDPKSRSIGRGKLDTDAAA